MTKASCSATSAEYTPTLPSKTEAYNALLRHRLAAFTRKTFATVSPGAEYKHNYHIDLIAEYLEACERREINRLLINLPPRMMKSISVTIAWPAWLLGRNPAERIVASSYADRLALKHSVDTRLVLQSEWYRRIFPHTQLTGDQNEKGKFVTTARGHRIATSVGAAAIGEGGNFLIFDDPLSPLQAASAVQLQAANDWFDQSFITRLDDKKNGVIVGVMQRLHANDLSGHLLEKGGWEHLCLPARAEAKTIIDFGRVKHTREVGEPLHADREGVEQLEKLEKEMGDYAFAGQYQQRPVPREGGLFKPDAIRIIDAAPAGLSYVRKWDLAATTNGDYSAGAKLGTGMSGRYCIADMQRFRLPSHEVEQMIVNTAARDGKDVMIHITQDPGQAGKAQAAYLVSKLAGYSVVVQTETGDKATRAMPFSAQVNVGNVDMVRGPWNDDLINELRMFPNGSYDDQVDALSGGFNQLAQPKSEPRIRSL